MKIIQILTIVVIVTALEVQRGEGLSMPITTNLGPITGQVSEDGKLFIFKGIPYASPPIGALRWKPPLPHPSWSSPLNATEFGNSCMQSRLNLMIPSLSFAPFSEDCLTLNVWAPSDGSPTSLYPVMVMVHGGGFIIGGSRDPSINGESLASNGPAIVVTLNYRLGAFGFLALSELLDEDQTTGNYGILDQAFALKWVKANAAAFGGDPNNIMLFGQSAGGNSMFIHLTSKVSAGSFNKIAIESGYFRGMLPLQPALGPGNGLLSATGCAESANPVDCLRSLSAESILNRTSSCQWLPVIDGTVLTDWPDELVMKGQFSQVPVLIGGVRNEATITVNAAFGDDFSAALYPTYTRALFTPLVGLGVANAVIKEYRPEQFNSSYWCLSSAFGDFNILCSSAYFANLLAMQEVPVYAFVFAYPPSSNAFYNTDANLGAYHASEIPFIWHDYFNFTAEENKLSAQIQGAWLNFAADSDPGWAMWTQFNQPSVQFDLPTSSMQVTMGIPERCAFWLTQPIYSPTVLTPKCAAKT